MRYLKNAAKHREKTLLVADLFCGAGGSSTGCRNALRKRGISMRLVAVNHWPIAVETHQKNHPDARHYCINLDAARPREIVPEGRLDLLMASPECTHHSQARGGRPISDQGRMSAWHVIRWCTELRVRCLLVENVPEFRSWGPLNREGRPIKARRGEYFDAFIFALERIGFRCEWRVLNAADYGDATTRQRFFLLARSDSNPIHWPRKVRSKNGVGTRRWRAAREIIDWDLKGKSIFTRKKPLSPKTLMRIYAGAVKFGWDEPYLVVLRNHMTALGLDVPLPTICANGNHLALATPVRDEPVVFQVNQGGNRTRNARGVDSAPLQTVVTRPSLGLTEPVPFIVPQRSDQDPTRTVESPVPTLTSVARIGVAQGKPFVSGNRTNNVGKDPENDPLPTMTTSTGGGLFMVESVKRPMVMRTAMHKSNALCARSVDDPLPTITTDGGLAVVEPGKRDPFLLNRHGDNGSVRAHSVDEPAPTSTARGAGYLVEPVPFVLAQGGGGAPRAAEDPLPTIVGEGAISLISTFNGNGKNRSVEEPLPTLTTKDRHALVVPTTHADASCRSRSVDDPLPTVTSAHRGELAFVAAAFGERPDQAPRVRSVEDPLPTVTGDGAGYLVDRETKDPLPGEPGLEERAPEFEHDVLFRMLEPHELAAAMSFSSDEVKYEFVGNKTEVTKQVGNAVPVRTAAALVGAIFADETKRRKKRKARA